MFEDCTPRYTIKTTNRSSHDYGPCEVCGKHATEVFHQRLEYRRGRKRYAAPGLFGHRECLLSVRGQAIMETEQCGELREERDE